MLMRSLASYVASGLAFVLAVDLIAPRIGAGSTVEVLGQLGLSTAAVSGNSVDRTLKGDRLIAARAASGKHTIATVEIVGLRNTAVVYRDHQGRELFRTDPLTNATVIAKGVVLPEVTIRESGASRVDPVPVNAPRAPVPDGKLPIGCESPVSPLAGPSPTNLLGRCVSQNVGAKFAAVSATSLAQSSR